MVSRRTVLTGLAAVAGLTPPVRGQARSKADLWDNRTGPHLRGAVIAQRRVLPAIDGTQFLGPGPVGAPVSDLALDRLAASGANLTILSHPGIFTETPPYRLDRDVLASLDDLVSRCEARGLFVVIGYRTGPGRSEFTFHRDSAGDWFPASLINETVWFDPVCHDGWLAMWRETARRFRARANVAGYLLMVEPNANQAGPQGEIWDADRLAAAVRQTSADWPWLAARLRQAIREVDQDTPLLVSPDGYASQAFEQSLNLPDDRRAVLCLHDYAPREYTHQSADSPVAYTAGSGLIAPPDYPRWMVGELGAVRFAPDLDRFLTERIGGLERAGAGWAWFRWDSGWRVYEDQENRFNLDYEIPTATPQAGPARQALTRAWHRNSEKPEQILRR